MPRRKATEEDGKPEFEPMPLYQISPEGWVEMERNRQNLIDAGWWFLNHRMITDCAPS
jgi:hypothetical protein